MSLLQRLFGGKSAPQPVVQEEPDGRSRLIRFPEMISTITPGYGQGGQTLSLFLTNFDPDNFSGNEDIGRIQDFLRGDGRALNIILNNSMKDVVGESRFLSFVTKFPNVDVRPSRFLADYSFAVCGDRYAFFDKGAGVGVATIDIDEKGLRNLQNIWDNCWEYVPPSPKGPHLVWG